MEKNTAKKRPYIRFYHEDWLSDGDVENMTMAEVGVYWTLLVKLMANGYLHSDAREHAKLLNVSLDQPEKAFDLLTPRIRKKFHTLNCRGKEVKCPGWDACNVVGDDPERLYNQKLTNVLMDMDAVSFTGRNNRLKSKVSLEDSHAAETPQFDFGEVLRLMPKRRVKGVFVGWEAGKVALKYITTQDEFDRLLQATRKYSAIRRGKDPEYHISFEKWVLGGYSEYAPPPSDDSAEALSGAGPAAAESKPVEKQYPPEWCRPPDAKRQLPPTEKPPWIPKRYATPEDKETMAKIFPDDNAKHAWWMLDVNVNKEVR